MAFTQEQQKTVYDHVLKILCSGAVQGHPIALAFKIEGIDCVYDIACPVMKDCLMELQYPVYDDEGHYTGDSNLSKEHQDCIIGFQDYF